MRWSVWRQAIVATFVVTAGQPDIGLGGEAAHGRVGEPVGSMPTMRTAGLRAFTAVWIPAIRPPPPMPRVIESTSGSARGSRGRRFPGRRRPTGPRRDGDTRLRSWRRRRARLRSPGPRRHRPLRRRAFQALIFFSLAGEPVRGGKIVAGTPAAWACGRRRCRGCRPTPSRARSDLLPGGRQEPFMAPRRLERSRDLQAFELRDNLASTSNGSCNPESGSTGVRRTQGPIAAAASRRLSA